MGGIVTLTTDFGQDDPYVAAMKGVILGINPEATIVDICHTVGPQDIRKAAFVLGESHPCFPEGTIHVVVVDPGVGSDRRAVVLSTPAACFVAPDNGVLTCALGESAGNGVRRLGPSQKAHALTNQQFWRQPVSATFHGRDIFAPVAAHLSLGIPPDRFGDRLDSLIAIPFSRPRQRPDGALTGHVLHIDRFGNLITDVAAADLPQGPLDIKIRGQTISGLSRTYAEARGLLALIGSSGRLEVSLRDGSARDLLGATAGDDVRVVAAAPGHHSAGRQSGGTIQ